MKKILILFIIPVALIVGFYALTAWKLPKDFKEVTFTISGKGATIHDKFIEYFGNEVRHDIDGDGEEDVVFLITERFADSTRFYAVGALKRKTGYQGSQAVLLGTDIAPQTLEKGEGRMIIFNYAERAAGEPRTTEPHIGRSIWLLLDKNMLEFGEVVQNFEGDGPRN